MEHEGGESPSSQILAQTDLASDRRCGYRVRALRPAHEPSFQTLRDRAIRFEPDAQTLEVVRPCKGIDSRG
jgi:hypothetical protein